MEILVSLVEAGKLKRLLKENYRYPTGRGDSLRKLYWKKTLTGGLLLLLLLLFQLLLLQLLLLLLPKVVLQLRALLPLELLRSIDLFSKTQLGHVKRSLLFEESGWIHYSDRSCNYPWPCPRCNFLLARFHINELEASTISYTNCFPPSHPRLTSEIAFDETGYG